MTDQEISRAGDRTDSSRGRPKTRAIHLLEKILSSESASAEQVAEALMVTVGTVEAYRTERIPMPLERQLLLATFAIERQPKHARLGHLLRGQIRATIAFALKETPTHEYVPPSARW